MKPTAFAVPLVLLVILGLATHLLGPAEQPGTPSGLSFPAPGTPETALLGTWAGAAGTAPAFRLTVSAVHRGWAEVLVEVGETFPPQRRRALAKLLPGGRLHVGGPLHTTFILSEDQSAFVSVMPLYAPLGPIVLMREAPQNVLAQALPLPEVR